MVKNLLKVIFVKMADSLNYNTVNSLLHKILNDLMESKEFEQFRLVGGTSLSSQIGHRMSIDIDMFTDALYGSIDFDKIDKYLKVKYPFVSSEMYGAPIANGKSYLVGNSEEECINLSST